MLAEVDAELRAALGVDVIGVWPRKNIFGYEASGWKPFTLFDGTPCLVPGNFNVTPAPDGGWLMYPEGDTHRARRPATCPRAVISSTPSSGRSRLTKTT